MSESSSVEPAAPNAGPTELTPVPVDSVAETTAIPSTASDTPDAIDLRTFVPLTKEDIARARRYLRGCADLRAPPRPIEPVLAPLPSLAHKLAAIQKFIDSFEYAPRSKMAKAQLAHADGGGTLWCWV